MSDAIVEKVAIALRKNHLGERLMCPPFDTWLDATKASYLSDAQASITAYNDALKEEPPKETET